jgi:hypothetical protein
VNLSVIWTMVVAIFFFVAGAFIPATIIVLIGYVRRWRGQENRSLVRLIEGILLRIGGAFLVLIFVGVIGGASIDAVVRTDPEGVIFPYFIFTISMFAGFFGSIALGVFAYRRGRGERLQMSN